MNDPIVAEVRVVRDALAKEYGYSIAKIFEMLRKLEAASGRQHLRLEPRRIATDNEGRTGSSVHER